MALLFHPLVVHFPIALWMTAALFDLLYVTRRQELHATIARWLIGLGLIGAAVSIAAGWRDLLTQEFLGVGTALRKEHTGSLWPPMDWGHSVIAYGSTAAFLVVFLGRWRRQVPPRWTLVLSLLGAALVAYAGYLGGELRKVM